MISAAAAATYKQIMAATQVSVMAQRQEISGLVPPSFVSRF